MSESTSRRLGAVLFPGFELLDDLFQAVEHLLEASRSQLLRVLVGRPAFLLRHRVFSPVGRLGPGRHPSAGRARRPAGVTSASNSTACRPESTRKDAFR
jgi:hypothetical protein